MSKRCCAQTCYNGQSTNKSVTYLGFPKSTYFAHKWATAAGREDLTKKPIQALIKYCLCSDHFTDECFVDPVTKTKLKKCRNPLQVPLPTIFKNNLVDNLRVKYTDPHLNVDPVSFDCALDCKEEPPVTETLHQDDSCENSYTALKEECAPNVVCVAEDYSKLEGLKPTGEIIFVLESEEISLPQVTTVTDGEYFEKLNRDVCRFCGDSFLLYEMCPMFSDGKVRSFVARIMPQISSEDQYPQSVCYKCSNKIKSCMDLINFFDSVQVKFRDMGV